MKKISGTLVCETIEEIVDPRHTAVLVIDVQNDNASPKGFLASKGIDISLTRETIPRIKSVLDEARRLGVSIFFMRVTRSSDGSVESAPRLRMLEKGVFTAGDVPYEREGTWGHEVLEELEPRPNERQIIKFVSSAFFGTPLDIMLKKQLIQSAVVVGLATEGCVEMTVRDLEQYGYYPVVLKDCVSSRYRDLHDAALFVMSRRYDVIAAEELLNIWRKN